MKKNSVRRCFLIGLAAVLVLGGLLFVLGGSIAQDGEYCTINDRWCVKLYKFDSTDFDRGNIRTKEIHIEDHGSQGRFTITNTNGTDYFIPHKTKAEWDKFKAHLPSGVTVTTVTTMPMPIGVCAPEYIFGRYFLTSYAGATSH